MFAAILRASVQPVALKFDPNQQREPKGSPHGGEFAKETPLEAVARFRNWERQQKELGAAAAAVVGMVGPRPHSRNTSAADMQKEPLPPTLAAAEDRIRDEVHEHVMVIRDGKPFRTMGSDSDTHVTFGEITDDELRDAVLTHNHPSGHGLSIQDGVTAAKRNVQEMRAVTMTGTHVIHRSGSTWPVNFATELASSHQQTMYDLGKLLRDKKITVDEANAQHHVRVYQRLQASLGGFIYTFEPKS